MKWNFVEVNRFYLLEVGGVGSSFFLEVFEDREGNNIGEE